MPWRMSDVTLKIALLSHSISASRILEPNKKQRVHSTPFMLFNSGEFLFFFLPVVFLIFIYLARTGNTGAQIVWLVIASVVFYGSWKPIYLLLMFFSMGMNFGLGRILSRQDKWRRRQHPGVWRYR